MGMFDTFILEPPIKCEKCGNEIRDFQSKHFGRLLETYKPGEIITGSHIHYGIIEESIYCDSCSNNNMKLFMMVWHNVYVGYEKDEQTAKKLLESIDRLNILEWLGKCQDEKNEWKRHFGSFYHSMEELWHYLKAEDKQKFLSSKRFLLARNLNKHLKSDDPLLSILKEYGVIMHDAADDMFEK